MIIYLIYQSHTVVESYAKLHTANESNENARFSQVTSRKNGNRPRNLAVISVYIAQIGTDFGYTIRSVLFHKPFRILFSSSREREGYRVYAVQSSRRCARHFPVTSDAAKGLVCGRRVFIAFEDNPLISRCYSRFEQFFGWCSLCSIQPDATPGRCGC